jgi:shikimate kinase
MLQSIIYLIGYRGTGKSTVARLLAERLGWEWCDADAELERALGKTIRQIFAEEGEAGFRDKEAHILKQLSERNNCVIATGGGVVLRPENREIIKRGRVIWLQASPEVIWARLQEDATTAERRPDLAQGGLHEIKDLLAQREPLYEALADESFDTSHQTPEEIADLVSRKGAKAQRADSGE